MLNPGFEPGPRRLSSAPLLPPASVPEMVRNIDPSKPERSHCCWVVLLSPGCWNSSELGPGRSGPLRSDVDTRAFTWVVSFQNKSWKCLSSSQLPSQNELTGHLPALPSSACKACSHLGGPCTAAARLGIQGRHQGAGTFKAFQASERCSMVGFVQRTRQL